MITKYIKEFEENTGHKVVFLTLSGSRLYGTDSENSDYDYKGIFIPSRKSVLLKQDQDVYSKNTNNSKEKNSKEDIDFTLHSVYQFFNLLKKAETGSTDLMFSMFREDTVAYKDEYFVNIMKEHYKMFLNKNMKSFVGYALGQSKKFGIKGARYDELRDFVKIMQDLKDSRIFGEDYKLKDTWEIIDYHIELCKFKYIKILMAPGPRSKNTQHPLIKYVSVLGKMFSGDVSVSYFIEKLNEQFNQYGNRTITTANTETKVDYKAMSHAFRVMQECNELLDTNFIKFPLAYANNIKAIKSGACDIDLVINEIEENLSLIDSKLLVSSLPDEADTDKIEELLYNLIQHY